MARSAWIDQSSFGMPIAVDENDFLLQHETTNDANGSAMDSYAQTGWIELNNGDSYIFLERIIPDFVFENATLKLTFYFADYPNDTPYVRGPFTVTNATKYVIVRGRKRLVSIKVESNDLGSFWRMGKPLYFGSESGKR